MTEKARASMLDDLARFAVGASFERLSPTAVERLKVHVLDALGCALGAIGAPPPHAVRELVDELGGAPRCHLIGGGASAPDRAALCNGALVRYLDFNDAYLAPGETCHPSDNLAAVLACAEYAGATGRDALAALALAYGVQCRLSEVAPVRARGFDHTVQLGYGAAAGAARALGLDPQQTANAIAIAGTTGNALRVARTGILSNWKGLAAPFTGAGAVEAALLAQRGISGPPDVFDGTGGLKEAISGPFTIDWRAEDLEAVRGVVLKRYNAEIHSQSAIEGILELQARHGFTGDEVASIDLETFDVAHMIIGGGAEGDKHAVHAKEQADHSLPYLVAVAVLDRDVGPAQYAAERIERADVQALLRRVTVRPAPDLSARFPVEMPCRIAVRLRSGATHAIEKADYQGYRGHPMSWELAVAKFDRLASRWGDEGRRADLVETVRRLDEIEVAELMALLGTPRESKGA